MPDRPPNGRPLRAGSAQAALLITKTVDPGSPSPAAENDVVRYNLSVSNTGPGSLTNVIISDVPDNLTNLNFTVTSPSPPPNNPGPGANQYRFNNLPAGETVTLNLDATVSAADTCPVRLVPPCIRLVNAGNQGMVRVGLFRYCFDCGRQQLLLIQYRKSYIDVG